MAYIVLARGSGARGVEDHRFWRVDRGVLNRGWGGRLPGCCRGAVLLLLAVSARAEVAKLIDVLLFLEVVIDLLAYLGLFIEVCLIKAIDPMSNLVGELLGDLYSEGFDFLFKGFTTLRC